MKEEKKLLRKKVRSLIRELEPEYIAESDRLILNNLAELPQFHRAKRIFAYFSTGREPDTHGLMELCRRLDKPAALPRISGTHMDFVLWDPAADELLSGPLGIPQPPGDLPAAIPGNEDLLIVPALCYDRRFFRLGQGGGYYDRYLENCPAFRLGLCREALLFNQLPREAHDLPVDMLITEAGIKTRDP